VRIVQLANFVSATSGGLQTTLRQLAEGYTRRGHEVVQVLPAKADGSVTGTWQRQVLLRSPALTGTGYRILVDVRRVRRVLEQLSADALEVHDRTTLRGIGGWARENGTPALAVSHERVDRWLNQWLPARLPLESMADRSNAGLARAFDTIVCTTTWAAAEFRRLGVTNVVTIPLGVDHHRFAARLEARRHEGVLLVMASRLSREKQPEIAVETVRELVRRGVNVRLIVAGDGPMRRQLTARGEGLPIVWLGYVSARGELAALFRAADVALAPGPVETFGLAALEALACGTPAVVNWRSALPEVVGPKAGRAAAGSGFTFADAVQELLLEPEVALRTSARARAEEFSWDTTVDGFLAAHQGARRQLAA
jgi:alpha-1,6-mannosyltransferase